jgi:NAD(P)H-nitrite reductase large subunit
MDNIVIIGNGISGITAARHIRKKSDHKITVISAESDHFFSRTALMYIYMGHMKFEHTKPYEDWFWEKNDIDLLNAHVTGLDETHKKIRLENGSELDYDTLIVATGSKSRMLGWPGQELKGVQGLYSLQDIELMEENTKGVSRAVISGGGLIGVEMAEMLHSRGVDVTILILESGYWRNVLPLEESEIICRHLEEHGIKVILNAEIKEIVGDDDGRVKNVVSKSGEKIDCQFVGLTVGVQPNLDFLENSNVEINRGILVDEYLRTSVQDIYAIGDCSEQRSPLPGRRAIEAVWYTGRMMGEVVAETICGKPVKYKPGVWFNSAKFFDIEYQTYGNVLPDLPENQNSFFWQSDLGSRCLRLVYEKASMKLIGINVFGIRFRHEVCDRWLKEGLTIFQVMENLVEANFDPEFHTKYEDDIVNSFNQLRLGEEVKITRKKKLFAGFFN